MRIDEQLKILSVKTNMTYAEIGEKIDKSPIILWMSWRR